MLSIGFIFWLLMIIWFIWSLPFNNAWQDRAPYAGSVLLFILFLLLGWHVFGPPIHG